MVQVLVAGGVLVVIAAIDLVVEARRRAVGPAGGPSDARVGEPVWEAVETGPTGGGLSRRPDRAGSSATPW